MFWFLLFLWMLKVSTGDVEVSCVFMQSCLLPCSFQSDSENVVRWSHLTIRHVQVHSFHSSKDQLDQLGLQNLRFRGRTSLFREQISRGNASLLLRGVKVQDEGRYECSTRTSSSNSRSFINLKVDAPVTEVRVSQVENRIVCSSQRIYPPPEFTWSVKLSSNTSLRNTIHVQQTEQQLYSISSSLVASDRDAALTYSCTVRTRRSRKKVTWSRPVSVIVSKSEATISCSSSNLTATSLVWRFNQSRILLVRTRTERRVSEEWRRHVKEVSESGSLTLQDLSSHQEGRYTCEVGDEEETMITSIILKMETSPGSSWIFKSSLFIIFGVVFSAVTVSSCFSSWS